MHLKQTTSGSRRTRWHRAIPATLLAGAVAWAAAAQGQGVPTTRQAPAAATTTPEGARHGRNGGAGRGGQPITTTERNEALEFLAKHAPARYAGMQAIRGQAKARIEDNAVRLVVLLRRTEREDSDLYRASVKRIEADDEIFRLTGALRAASGDAVEKTRKQLRDAVAVQVDARLGEQRARLEQLARTLKTEQQRLDQDVQQRDKLVADQYDQYLADNGQHPFGNPGHAGGRPNRPAGERGQ